MQILLIFFINLVELKKFGWYENYNDTYFGTEGVFKNNTSTIYELIVLPLFQNNE
jgi:hypothetical protein